MRSPLTLTCQAYRLAACELWTPTVAPTRLIDSRARHPHDCVFPDFSWYVVTDVVFPQSQQQIHDACFDSSSNRRTVSLPNLFPIILLRFMTALRQPHDVLGLSVNAAVSLSVVFPQSHRHSHAKCPLRLLGPITVRLPNLIPVKSATPNSASRLAICRLPLDARISFLTQPQDTVCPERIAPAANTFSVPHSHRHSQCAPRLSMCDSDNTVNFPYTSPVKSFLRVQPQLFMCPLRNAYARNSQTLPHSHLHHHSADPLCTRENSITCSFPKVFPFISFIMFCSKKNAPHAPDVLLTRPHVKHERRRYQYSTRACGLVNNYFSTDVAEMEGV